MHGHQLRRRELLNDAFVKYLLPFSRVLLGISQRLNLRGCQSLNFFTFSTRLSCHTTVVLLQPLHRLRRRTARTEIGLLLVRHIFACQ